MKDDKLRKLLSFKIQKSFKKEPSTTLRMENIEFIKNLDREGLVFSSKERALILWENDDELLSIQYPGKETESKKNPRPWDFRPKLYYKKLRKYENDLSFGNIWEILEAVYARTNDKNKKYISAVAALIYRMAFMLDFEAVSGFNTKKIPIKINDKIPKYGTTMEVKLDKFYMYSPNSEVIDFLQQKLGNFGEMSLMGFLYYNHLLALNEDCKYYYRNKIKAEEKNKKTVDWIKDTGRVNNLLTHIAILSHYFGNIRVANLVYRVILKRGVCPCNENEIKVVCDGFIKDEDNDKPDSLFD